MPTPLKFKTYLNSQEATEEMRECWERLHHIAETAPSMSWDEIQERMLDELDRMDTPLRYIEKRARDK